MSQWLIIMLFFILLPAVIFDCKYHRIPNIISLSGWVIGPVLYAISETLPAISSSLYGFIFIFVLSFPFYVLRWMGAGDIKLMAGIGAIVGLEYAPEVLLSIVLTGALMGIILLLYHKLLKDSLQRYGAMIGIGITLKKPVYLPPNENEQKIVLPYALPISVGTFLFIGLTYIKV